MPNKQEDREDLRFRILKLIEQNPELNQRDLAQELGVSLGKTNYVLKALVAKGMVKLDNFNRNQNKLAIIITMLKTHKKYFSKNSVFHLFLAAPNLAVSSE